MGRSKRKSRVSIAIPYPALSTNKMYSGKKRRSGYYKAFNRKVLTYLYEHFDSEEYVLKGNLALKLRVGFSSSLSDLSNAIKAIEDIVAGYFKFNDRQIVYIQLEKVLVNKGEEFMELTINKTNRKVDYRRRSNGKENKQ